MRTISWQVDAKDLKKMFFTGVIATLSYYFFSNILLYQLQKPVLFYVSSDLFFWLFASSGIPQFLSGNSFIAFAFDLALYLSAVLSLLFINNKVFPRAFLLLYVIYFLTLNLYINHHFHLVGILFMSAVFLFRKDEKVRLLSEGARYYFLFLMFSAAIWKIARGTLWQSTQFAAILKKQSTEYLVLKSSSLRSDFIYFLIDHTVFSHILWICAIILQCSYAAGFFTRRYDWLLAILFICFSLFTWITMHVICPENMFFLLSFLPVRKTMMR